MPRNGSGVYSPDWVNATPNTTIESSKTNAMVADFVSDANAARPITAGGTGETTARLKDGTWRFQNTADTSKLLAFDLSGLSSGTRTLTVPDESARLALAPHMAGYLYGLTLSHNAVDATNDIDISTGVAIDSTNTAMISISGASLTKRLDAAWVVGTGNGGLDTGTVADGTYHVFAIKRVDTNVTDVLFSLSPTAPTMPANYTLFRRIGSIIRAAGAITPFVQNGDRFRRKEAILDVDSANPGTGAQTRILSVPTGIVVQAEIAGVTFTTTTSTDFLALFTALDETDTAPTSTYNTRLSTLSTAGTYNAATQLFVKTNTSAQIRSRLSASDANTRTRIVTFGWIDTRGRG